MSDGNPKTVTRWPKEMPSVPQKPNRKACNIYNRSNSGMQSRDSLCNSPEIHCKISVHKRASFWRGKHDTVMLVRSLAKKYCGVKTDKNTVAVLAFFDQQKNLVTSNKNN